MSYVAETTPGLIKCLNERDRVMASLDDAERAWLADEIARYRAILRTRESGNVSEPADRMWLEVRDRQGRSATDEDEDDVLNVGRPLDPDANIVRKGLTIIERGGDGERIEFEADSDVDCDGTRLRQRTLHKRPTYRRAVEADVAALARTMRRKRQNARRNEPATISPLVRPSDRIDDIDAPSDQVAAIALQCAKDWKQIGAKLRRCQWPQCTSAGAPCWFLADGKSTSSEECAACRGLRTGSTRWRARKARNGADSGDDAAALIEYADQMRRQGSSSESRVLITRTISFEPARRRDTDAED